MEKPESPPFSAVLSNNVQSLPEAFEVTFREA